MALGIFVEPITPNAVYTDNIFVVTEPSYQEANFRYICNIYPSGSSDLLTQVKTIPNDKGAGVFNLSVPLQGELYNDNIWKAGESASVLYRIDSSSRNFRFEFGVEYGTSPSSSITQFPIDPSDILSGNFFYGSIDQNETNRSTYMKQVAGQTENPYFKVLTPSTSYGYPLLSNKPTSSGYVRYAGTEDYETVSLFRGEQGNVGGWAYYSASLDFNGVSSSISFGEDFDWGGQTLTSGFILSLGVGPQNIIQSNVLGTLDFENYLYYDVKFHYRNINTTESFITEPIRYINSSYKFSSNWSQGPPLAGGSTTAFFGAYAGIATAGTLNDAILTLGTTQQNVGNSQTHVWNGSVWSKGASMPTDYYYGGAAGKDSTGTISVCGNIFGSAAHSNQTLLGGSNGWISGPNYPLLLAGLNGVGEGSASAAFVGGQYWTGVVYDEVSTQYVFNGTTYSSPSGLPNKSVYHAVIGDDVNDYLVVGGYVNGAISNVSYQWDGNSFTSIANYPLNIMQHAGVGTTNDAFVYGGFDFTTETAASYKWDGTSWMADAPLIAPRAFMGAAGTSTGCFAAGGGEGELGLGGTQLTDILGNNLPSNEASPSQFYGDTGIEVVQPLGTCYDETRFAFINNLGVWDYYSIFNPVTKSTRLRRESFQTPNATYNSENQGFAPYGFNASKRGNTTYYTSNKDNYVITTDPLSQEDADWLGELIESPNVYIQSGSDFIPVNINNRRYDSRTNPKGQKIFQYTIEFSYSNNRRSTY